MAAVAALTGVAVVWTTGRGHGSSAGSLAPETPLTAYRLVYRVQIPGAADHEEERDVARPFKGRYEERAGGAVTSGFLTTSDGAWAWITSGAAPGWVPAEAGLNRAAADQHAGAALASGLRYGLARVVGHSVLLGRPCTIVRTGAPLGSPLTAPTTADHADVCVDATGLILEETWTRNSHLARRRRASTLDIAPVFSPDTFKAQPLGDAGLRAAATIAQVRPATDADTSGAAFTFTPPPGYEAAGPLEVRTGASGNGLPGVAETIQFFTSGSDVIDMVQGEDAGQPPGIRVPVAGGQGFLSLDMTASSVEVVDGSGRYARIEGADVDGLLSAASGLRPVR